MAGMTLQQIDAYVRDTMELDSTEISDSLLHSWVQEAYDHVIEDAVTWRFLEHQWALTTSSSTNEHSFDAIVDGSYTPFEISWVFHPEYGNLSRVPHERAMAAFVHSSNTSRPIYWSTSNNDSLYLWERPDAAYSLVVSGYRNKLDWIALGAGQRPDCPNEFHPLIARWALGLAYAQQDQADMTVLHHNAVEAGVRQLRRKWVKNGSDQPLVLNEGLPTQERMGPLVRPLFSFE